MRLSALSLFACLCLTGVPAAAQAPALGKPSLAEPSLSPDGATIAFVSGGAIWTAPASGGEGRLLVSDQATDSRPYFSPDGSQLAFTSTRSGAANVYVLTLATGQVRRLTFADVSEQLDGWSRDGKWLYFSSPVNDIARQNDIFRVSVEGGTPLEVSNERYLGEFQAAPSPDGTQLALMAKGLAGTQWWRNGHAHIDEAELWLKPIAQPGGYRRLLGPTAKHAWPMWSPDGRSLYYMSDESGSENIWRASVDGSGAPQQLTAFTKGRLLFPAIANDGRSMVFERDFAIWRLDLTNGQAAQVPITLVGAAPSPGVKHLNIATYGELALSPDGAKAALIAHGEVFAASAKDGGVAQRVTHTPEAESELAWSPDSRRVVYARETGADTELVLYDFTTGKEQAFTRGDGLNEAPAWSPDGKMIAYVRSNRELHLITVAAAGGAAKDQTLYTGALLGFGGDRLAWSPDSRWVAFFVTDHKSFRNVNVAAVDGSTVKPVSFLANGSTSEKIAWSPDGRYILFDSAQRSEEFAIVRVDLVPHTPKYREDLFRDLFKPTPEKTAAPMPKTGTPGDHANPAPASKPSGEDGAPADDKSAAAAEAAKKAAKIEVRIVFDGIRERASFLPLGMSAQEPVISPDGKTLVFKSEGANGVQGLYAYSLDELAKEPPSPQQLAIGRKPKSGFAFTPDSKAIYFLDGDVLTTTPIESPKLKAIAVSAEMDVDFDIEKMVVFDEAWSTLDRRFFDPTFNGRNWSALRDEWRPYIEGVHTEDELRRDLNLLIGELNASHSGMGVAGAPAPLGVGELGLRFDRPAYEAGKGLVITEVIALGPAAIEGTIRPGETLVAVNGVAVGPHVNLDELMLDQVGKRVVLTIADHGKTREAVVRPVSTAAAAGLLYRQWVNAQRAYVEKLSGGKLGYVHIPDMSDASLAQLYIDLDAQNEGREGVVIDVRNNNGGYINGRVLDVFSRKNYLLMTPRDLFPVPSRQNLGQRALGLPTILLVNESSLSDAEDFTEGYRALGLGEIVGVPTAGWIIYTGGRELIDGSTVRMPFIRVQTLGGEDMELHPRPVDVEVERPLGETETGHDVQLETAVKELLKKVP
jgi:Tol biopolymer transport system component/C-terminal processing protease CtpA/Prc